MTWSITAKDPATGAFGVAVTTKFFGVGAICPFAAAGIGAISTQAFVNPTFGPRGLRLLAEGLSAEQVLNCLIESDEGREHRQLHLIDSQGRVAARTGDECIDWNGHRLGEGFSVAGNMLAGEAVVADTFDSFIEPTAGRALPRCARCRPGRRWRLSRQAIGRAADLHDRELSVPEPQGR